MRFGAKILFKNTSLQLNPGNHYGLVGANGTGKSTLIKVMIGDLTPETGIVALPSQVTIATLKQDHYLYEEVAILNVVIMGKKALWDTLQKKELLLQKEDFSEEDCETLDQLEKKIAREDGYAAESQAAKLLEGLGLTASVHHQPLSTLSGGYKLRVLLAQLLFSKPDILLLDEPTNHLDLFSIRWLEGYLKGFPGTLLVSSHDRNFLNATCDHIIDLDHETLKIYKGNFEDFMETKALFLEQAELILEKQEKRRDDLQTFVDRFKAKASKARQAQSKMRLVEKLEHSMEAMNQAPTSRRYPHLNYDLCRQSGAITLKVKELAKSYGEKKVLHGLSLEIERGDRVAFLGPNGIGKSTLLEILTGFQSPCSGSFEWGHASHIAYFPQDHAKIVQGPYTVLQWLSLWETKVTEQHLRSILGKVLFSGDDVHKLVECLSGGEAARLLLARMMLQKHNILIFDEPTNHLDMESVEALEEALLNYPGTILFVSHNRHFVSEVANRIIEISPSGIFDRRCSFEEYLEMRDQDFLSAQSKPKKETSTKESSLAFNHSKQEQKAKSQLEKQAKKAEENCQILEQKIKQLETSMSHPSFFQITPKDEIQKILSQKINWEKDLENALIKWEQSSQLLN